MEQIAVPEGLEQEALVVRLIGRTTENGEWVESYQVLLPRRGKATGEFGDLATAMRCAASLIFYVAGLVIIAPVGSLAKIVAVVLDPSACL